MAFNQTEAERVRRVAEDTAQKIKLEKPLASKIRTILRDIASDLEDFYISTGRPLDSASYRDDFVGVLRPAYRRAAKSFGSQFTSDIESNSSNTDEAIIASLAILASQREMPLNDQIAAFKAKKNSEIVQFIDQTVPRKADLITKTNQKEINRAISNAVAQAAITDEPMTRTQIGKLAGKNFKDSALYRGALIAQTEINEASEGAKLIEAESLNEEITPLRNQGSITLTGIKEWRTVGDQAVRREHRLADMQQQTFRQPFLVGGQLLQK